MLFSHVTQNGVKLYNFDISELQNHTIGEDTKVYNNIVDSIKNAVVDSSFSYPLNPSRNGTDVVLWTTVWSAITGATMMVKELMLLVKTTLTIIHSRSKLKFAPRHPLHYP
jgi:hypothetical protein